MGEGGAVLQRNNTVLISKAKRSSIDRKTIQDLVGQGFKVGYLPRVDVTRQKFQDYAVEHNDGHAALVEDNSGKSNLVVARSYVSQSMMTRDEIQTAAKASGVKEVVDVDDRNLPPLSFNLIQLADGSVAMTGGAEDLEKIISQMVGPEKVNTTDEILEDLVEALTGSMRCLTNTLLKLPEIYYRVSFSSLHDDPIVSIMKGKLRATII